MKWLFFYLNIFPQEEPTVLAKTSSEVVFSPQLLAAVTSGPATDWTPTPLKALYRSLPGTHSPSRTSKNILDTTPEISVFFAAFIDSKPAFVEFCVAEVKYLKYILDKNGLKLDSEKVAYMNDFPMSKMIRQNFSHAFWENIIDGSLGLNKKKL